MKFDRSSSLPPSSFIPAPAHGFFAGGAAAGTCESLLRGVSFAKSHGAQGNHNNCQTTFFFLDRIAQHRHVHGERSQTCGNTGMCAPQRQRASVAF